MSINLLQHFFVALFVCFSLEVYLNNQTGEKFCKEKLLNKTLVSVTLSFLVLFLIHTVFVPSGWDGTVVVYGDFSVSLIIFLVVWNLAFVGRAIWLLEKEGSVLVLSKSILFAFTWPLHLTRLIFHKMKKSLDKRKIL